MSRIFLSHSSKNNAEAKALADWLAARGFDDVFLDLDPQRGIAAGERWERALNQAAQRCEAVLFLVSEAWLDSDWCLKEFNLAHRLNKCLFGVLIEDIPLASLPATLTGTWQLVPLVSGRDHIILRAILPTTHEEVHVTFSYEGLTRLKIGLERAGLDPKFFAWPPESDPGRAPYRGLRPLEAEDAGIFFGREAATIGTLDRLRGLSVAATPRFLAILGASGAGKSSYLRAGVLPKLTRDDRHFLPLPVVRPERAAITGESGLLRALEKTLADHDVAAARADIREAIAGGAGSLQPLLANLVDKAHAPLLVDDPKAKPPVLVLPIDQGEELFHAEGAQEGQALLTLLAALIAKDSPAMIAIVAIRSDSYERLQTAKPLEGVDQHTISLPPMPRSSYKEVIEGPAKRLDATSRSLAIDPALTQALLADIDSGGGRDALPLLAFTLERLYLEFGARGRLALADYEELGGVKGSIEAAVERALRRADGDPRIPADHVARLTLLRRGLIPWLAGVDPETKTPRRRVARVAQIPKEARPLIDLLVEQRLLTRDSSPETGEATIEPAHEALLRQWGGLKGWLEEDFGRLATLEGVKRASRDWDANARDGPWEAHTGARLEEADRLDSRPDLAAMLDATDREYLAACRAKEQAGREKERAFAASERRAAQRTRIGLAVASLLAMLAVGAAGYGFRQAHLAREQGVLAEERKQEAERQTLRSEQRSALLASNVAQSLTAEGQLDSALLLLLNAGRSFDDATVPDTIRIALTKALEKKARIETKTLFPKMQVFETDEALYLVNMETNEIYKLTDSLTPRRVFPGVKESSPIVQLAKNIGDDSILLLREDLSVERISDSNGAQQVIGHFTEAKAPQGWSYSGPENNITWNGFVQRSFLISDRLDKAADRQTRYYLQIMDTKTAKIYSGIISGDFGDVLMLSGVLKSPDGKELRIVGGEPKSVAGLQHPADDFALVDKKCVAEMPAELQRYMFKRLHETYNEYLRVQCRRFGKRYLITIGHNTSSGMERDYKVFLKASYGLMDSDIKPVNIGVRGKFDWIGLDPESDFEFDYAVLSYRNAIIPMATHGNQTFELNYRYPTTPTHARLIKGGRFLVVEPEAGRIVMHDLNATPARKTSLLTSETSEIVGTRKAIKTINTTTCHGIPGEQQVFSLGDGRDLVFRGGGHSRFYGGPKEEQNAVSGDLTKQVVIDLGDNSICVQISADRRRLLDAQDEIGATIYDLDAVIASGGLKGNQVASVTVNGLTSAFFFDTAGNSVVTTNETNKVVLWTWDIVTRTWINRELFRGESPIRYAEPDPDFKRLMIIDNPESETFHGFLYSIPAGQIWYDFGEAFRVMSVAFDDKSEIVVSKDQGNEWAGVFPILPLSSLVKLAKQELSVECVPSNEGEYSSSPCWPASYQ